MIILSVANAKGGVGKTTTAMNLSAALAEKGKKVCLVSLDPQINLNNYVGFKPDGRPGMAELLNDFVAGQPLRLEESIRFIDSENFYYIPSSQMLSIASTVLSASNANHDLIMYELFRQEGFQRFDYVILDCKPSFDLSVINALAASDGIIIPVQATKMAFEGLNEIMEKIKYLQNTSRPDLKVVGILTTMYATGQNMSQSVNDALNHAYSDMAFGNYISKSVDAEYSAALGHSLLTFRKNKLADQYRAVANEVIGRVEV